MSFALKSTSRYLSQYKIFRISWIWRETSNRITDLGGLCEPLLNFPYPCPSKDLVYSGVGGGCYCWLLNRYSAPFPAMIILNSCLCLFLWRNNGWLKCDWKEGLTNSNAKLKGYCFHWRKKEGDLYFDIDFLIVFLWEAAGDPVFLHCLRNPLRIIRIDKRVSIGILLNQHFISCFRLNILLIWAGRVFNSTFS